MSDTAETCDRNKTDLTRKVTAGIVAWLHEHGFKPVESEVTVAPGWCADLAGVITPTHTEAQALRLVPRKPRPPCGLGYEDAMKPWYELVNALPDVLTTIVEVKTARSDFARDDKWSRTPAASLSWLAVPVGLIAPEKYPPSWWGVVECEPENGAVAKVRRWAPLSPVTVESRLSLVLAVAVRRDHATRYARHREFMRQATAARNESESRLRMGRAIDAVCEIVKGEGGSVEQVLQRERLKRLPFYTRQELDRLWGIGRNVSSVA
jgi:hypothetical protein